MRRPLPALALAAALLLGALPDAVSLRTLDGTPVEIAREPGERALVLHFWAGWCPECAEEMPALDRSVRACSGRGVRVIAVNVGESAEDARAFASRHGVAALPILLDDGGRVWRRTGLRGLPANLVYTENGVARSEGAASADSWRQQLAKLGCEGGDPDGAAVEKAALEQQPPTASRGLGALSAHR